MTLPHFFLFLFNLFIYFSFNLIFSSSAFILNVNWYYVCTWHVSSVRNKWWLIDNLNNILHHNLNTEFAQEPEILENKVTERGCSVDNAKVINWLIPSITFHGSQLYFRPLLQVYYIFFAQCSDSVLKRSDSCRTASDPDHQPLNYWVHDLISYKRHSNETHSRLFSTVC